VDGAIADLDQAFAMITALLRIGQIQGTARRAGFAPVSLNAIATEAAHLYQPIAELGKVALSVTTSHGILQRRQQQKRMYYRDSLTTEMGGKRTIGRITGMGALWRSIAKAVSDDSMSIALFSLFLACVAGQGLSGWFAYSGSLLAEHNREITFCAYLGTGNFLDAMLSNWQAAILQLAVLIVFSSVLRQKGAAHSRKADSENYRTLGWMPGSQPTVQKWLYANSLSLVFVGMFVVTFMLHMLFGEWKYNEDHALLHLAPISFGSYAGSSSFWFSVFQCWEAEFGAIGIYIVLSIYLRQERSPESKPVEASNEQTGGANE
jgi:hypothetical protein